MRNVHASIKNLARTAAAMRSMSDGELLDLARRVVGEAGRDMGPDYWRANFITAMENASVARSMDENAMTVAYCDMAAIVCSACLIRAEEGGEQ